MSTPLRRLFTEGRALFMLVVALPTALSATYYGVMASDVYVSESQFVVRSPQQKTPSLLGAALQNVGFRNSQDDAYLLNEYILSRDALTSLENTLKVKDSYAASTIDVLSRFNGFGFDDSFEALYEYYRKHIGVRIDTLSSAATLTVRAYSAEQAQQINSRLLDLGEALVNRINERGRRDLIEFSQQEVTRAEAKATEATLALSAYRNKTGVVDPQGQATIQLEQISSLQQELIKAQGQLAQLQSFAANNPQVPALKKRIQSLQSAIAGESQKVTGGSTSFANTAGEYQRLELQQTYADQQLGAAMAALDQARSEASRKLLYLERVVQPNVPDSALEPRRLRAVITTLILSLLAWGVLRLITAGVKEHHD